jgi:hypothetical protein
MISSPAFALDRPTASIERAYTSREQRNSTHRFLP